MSEEEKVICSVCGSVIRLRVYSFPCRDSDTADCPVCNNVLRSWSGSTETWGVVDVIERKENHKNQDNPIN